MRLAFVFKSLMGTLVQYAELARFAARVQGLKLAAWEKSTCLREIMVETVIARQIEFRLYSKASGQQQYRRKILRWC